MPIRWISYQMGTQAGHMWGFDWLSYWWIQVRSTPTSPMFKTGYIILSTNLVLLKFRWLCFTFQENRMTWEQEIYNGFKYHTPRTYFHTFAADVSNVAHTKPFCILNFTEHVIMKATHTCVNYHIALKMDVFLTPVFESFHLFCLN